METSYIFLLAFLLVLLHVNDCSATTTTTDLKAANVSTNSGLDPINVKSSSNEKTGGSILVTNSAQSEKGKEVKGDQVNTLNDDIHIKKGTNETNSSKQSGSKEVGTVQKSNGDSEKGLIDKEGGNKKEEFAKEVKPKDVGKEGGNVEESDPRTKEGTPAEECDSSNNCMVNFDDGKKFVACLRVPGNDSPDLSLLIQNKGKGPLTITISGPDYVQLEKTKVELQAKEDNQKLKVSVRGKGADNLIIIKAGNGNCSLDFRDLIVHNSADESDNTPESTYLSILSQKSTIAFVCFAALLILASGWTYVSFRRRQLSSNASKYQRLDLDLPVSGVAKPESDTNDGWDNSWGDDWDDEEAPKTPSLPITPSLSSKGLASRRLNKENWKD